MRMSRWLRGAVSAAPHGKSYVRIAIEREYGSVRAEVYLTKREARALRERLQQIEAYHATERQATRVPA